MPKIIFLFLGELVIQGGVNIVGFTVNFAFITTQTTITTTKIVTHIIGGAKVITTQVGAVVQLNEANQCITLEPADENQACLVNPEACTDGFTVTWKAQFSEFIENTVYLSQSENGLGEGLSLKYEMGVLRAVLRTKTEEWFVALPELNTNEWYDFEFAWKQDSGLIVHANNVILGSVAAGIARAVPADVINIQGLSIGR